MFSFLRRTVPRTNIASQSRLVLEDGRSAVDFHPDSSKSSVFMTYTFPSGETILKPPYHWHMFQTKTFGVVSGVMLATVDGVEKKVRAGESLTITPCTFYKVSAEPGDETLVVNVSLDPLNRARDEAFFRNMFGYLDDCRKEGKELQVPQMALLLHSADTALAPPRPKFISMRIGKLVNLVVGVVVGKWLLGFSDCYPEYYKANVG